MDKNTRMDTHPDIQELDDKFPSDIELTPRSSKHIWNRIALVIGFLLGVGLLAFIVGNSDRSETIVAAVPQDQPVATIEPPVLSRLLAADEDLATLVAERDAALDKIERLEGELLAAVEPSVVDALQANLAASQALLTDKEEEIASLVSNVSKLEAELASQQASNRQTELELAAETSRADEMAATVTGLVTALDTEVGKVPAELVNAVRWAQPRLETHHFIGVEWTIERRWFWGLNDENHLFRSDGTVVYGSIKTTNMAFWQDDEIVISIGLPEVKDYYFRMNATSFDPNSGFLNDIGHTLGGETEFQPLFVEAERLLYEKACGDLTSLKVFVSNLAANAKMSASGHQVTIVWRDSRGSYHDQLSDQLLLDNACG